MKVEYRFQRETLLVIKSCLFFSWFLFNKLPFTFLYTSFSTCANMLANIEFISRYERDSLNWFDFWFCSHLWRACVDVPNTVFTIHLNHLRGPCFIPLHYNSSFLHIVSPVEVLEFHIVPFCKLPLFSHSLNFNPQNCIPSLSLSWELKSFFEMFYFRYLLFGDMSAKAAHLLSLPEVTYIIKNSYLFHSNMSWSFSECF